MKKLIYNQLLEWKNSNPDFVFIKHNRAYSLSDIIHEVDSLAKGIRYIPDKFIGIYTDSSIDIIFLYLACIKINKTPIIFQSSWSESDVNHATKKYNIEHVVSDWNNKHMAKKHFSMYYIEELINSSRGCGTPSDINTPSGFECVLFTSGSTGKPKGVRLTKDNFKSSVAAWNEELSFTSQDNYVLCLPVSHIAGLSILYRAIYYRFSITLIDNYRELSNVMEGTVVSLVPTILNRLIEDKTNLDTLGSYRAIIIGGEPASKELLNQCLLDNLNVFVSYGMTETCSGVSGYWIKRHPDKLESVGKPFKGVQLSTVDEHVSINSLVNMMGYFLEDNLESSFITSDLGEIIDGFLYIKGRSIHSTISGGEKINIDYVKETLIEHPSIQLVDVIVIQDKEWGESIEVNLTVSCSLITEHEVKDWCRGKLAEYAIPKKINIQKIVTI